MSTITHKNNCL